MSDGLARDCVRTPRGNASGMRAIGARVGAAAFVLGMSLAAPHALGVAVADRGADSTSTASGTSQRGSERPPGQRPASRLDSAGPGPRRSRTAPRIPAGRPEPAAGALGDPPSRAQIRASDGLPAATGVGVRSNRRGASLPGRAATTEPVADLGPIADPAAVTPSAVPVAPVRSVDAPDAGAPPPAASAVLLSDGGPPTVPTPAPAAPAAELRGVAGALERMVNSVGNWLSTLPVTPLSDVMSGAVWLVRRAVVPVGSGLWSPALCAACTGQLLSPTQSAQVLTVTNRVDGEPGSLRDVLSRSASGDVIRFSPLLTHATLTLTLGALDINTSVRIAGTQQTLDAAGRSRIMVLDAPGTAIVLSGLNFANGSAPGDQVRGTAGGAILADSVTLDICGARFSGNSAVATDAAEGDSSFMQYGLGGAIAAFGSAVTISDSDFGDNRAAGADNNKDQQPSAGLGGAILAENSAVTLLRSRFSGNSATGGSGVTPIAGFSSADGGLGAGGAVFASGGSLSATDVTFAHNSAAGGDGLAGSAANPYGNGVGGGGNASGGALWTVGPGRDQDPIPLTLTKVLFSDNTATGGAAGAQVVATLAARQGGRASGGGFGAVEWVTVRMDDVTLQDNLAQGGGAGANAADAGRNTGTGGVALGGAGLLVSPSSIQATHLSVRHNTSRGGPGADSAAVPGTQAGEGGFAYGGGALVNNGTGSLDIPAIVIPVGIRQAEFVANRSLGGEAGTGPVPPDGRGSGGLAQGGAMEFDGLFETRLVAVRFIGNSALAGQGKSAAGGALINPYGRPGPSQTATLQIQNSLFRGNTAVGGDDAADVLYRQTRGGAFYNFGLGTVVSGSRFDGNKAVGGDDTGSGHLGSALGGAVYSEASADPSIAIFNTTFADNSALGGRRGGGQSIAEPSSGEAHGGALYAQNGTTTVNGGAFVGNRAVARAPGEHTAGGGAIEIVPVTDAYVNDLSTTGVRFGSNTATSQTGVARGGAVAFNGTAFTDDGSTFSGNAARSGWGTGSAYGGALYLERDSRLNGSAATGNRAVARQGFGGGVALPNGPQVLTQVQTDIRGNWASTAGNQLWWPDGTPLSPVVA